MKNTTRQILNILEEEKFSELFKLNEAINLHEWTDQEYHEMKIQEAILILEETRNILFASIKNENNLLETILVYKERHNIQSQLQNLKSYIEDLLNGRNNISNFIQSVQEINQISSKLEKRIDGYPNYKNKLKNINYLKHKYENFISNIKKSEEVLLKTNEHLKKITEINTTIANISDEIKRTNTQITTNENDINTKYAEIKTNYSNIVDLEARLKEKTDFIEKFHVETNEYIKKINEGLHKIEIQLTNNKDVFEETIDNNNDQTRIIIEKNKQLQEAIFDILGKSIGTNLYESFKTKAKFLFYQSLFWLLILFLSIWFLADSGLYLFEQITLFIKANNTFQDIQTTFFLRLTLIFPAIYAIYFSTSEFKNTTKLKEEYDFKSSVSVALNHFKELAKNENQPEIRKFLIDATKNIFKSPTDQVFNNKKINDKKVSTQAKEIISDMSNIIGKITNTHNNK